MIMQVRAMEPRLCLKRSLPQAGLKPGTAELPGLLAASKTQHEIWGKIAPLNKVYRESLR